MLTICRWRAADSIVLLLFLVSTARADHTFGSLVRPFLDEHCITCHSGPEPENDLDLQFSTASSVADEPELWKDVVHFIEVGDMPPSSEPRPAVEDVAQVAEFLTAELARVLDHSPAAPVPLKRLTRREYRNCIRDLFSIDYRTDQRFPADEVGHGFDNIADLLTLSPLLLEKYLDAAESIASQAVYDRATDTPPWQKFSGAALEQRGRGLYLQRGVHVMSTNAEVFFDYPTTVPGRYRIRSKLFGQQAGSEIVKMAFTVDGKRKRVVEVPDPRGDPGEYSIDTEFDLGNHRVGVAFINDYWDPDNPDPNQRDRNAGVVEIEISGPLDAPTLPTYQERRLPRPVAANEWRRILRPIVSELMRRAYRRRVESSELESMLDHMNSLATEHDSVESRWRTAIVTLLVSPNFLFRAERETPTGATRLLDPFEVASRLSFFLWSSLPDEELLRAAEEKETLAEKGLRQQVRRMLADARSRSLVTHFAEQWLQIRTLGEMLPDPERFPTATQQLLEDMKEETLALFECVLRERRSVWSLLDADFTFVNARLAEHYGLPAVHGDQLRRVPLQEGRSGGLLRHASILTLTSTPTRPSPVLRGKWILEVLLDAAPPPPPPDITSLVEAASRDAHTLREQLEVHRADPKCSGCHSRMDPLGFGLQNFDAVGRFRSSEGRQPIDASGVLPDGREFSGPDGLLKILMGERGFLKSLSKNLLIFALGRGTTVADRPLIEKLIEGLQQDPTLERLITDIVLSDAFRKRASK